jgi:hypothetical protein
MQVATSERSARKKPKSGQRHKKSNGSKKLKDADRRLAEKCGKLLDDEVTSMQFPGGRSRRSFRLILANADPVIASIRPRLFRAKIERRVLRDLSAIGAPVPRLLANDGRNLLIQEEIVGQRLAQSMHCAEESRVEAVLDSALSGLAQTHRAGSESGFDARLATLGESVDWLVGFLDRPAVMGNILEVPAPRPKLKQLEELLSVREPRFIKWDARPGNAMVRDDGEVFWFDWEHCGTRNRLDDMAWLLADEYVPEYPTAEARLIDKHIASFADDLSIDEARQYLSAYGVFHMSVRLGLILKYKMQGDWWNHDYCVNGDKVGVTWECTRRLCRRGERWARRNPHTEPLARWFRAVCARFERDTFEESVHSR